MSTNRSQGSYGRTLTGISACGGFTVDAFPAICDKLYALSSYESARIQASFYKSLYFSKPIPRTIFSYRGSLLRSSYAGK